MAEAASKIRIGFALYPDADLLDVTGPAEVFAAAAVRDPAELLFVAADRSLVKLGPVRVEPSAAFAECPPLDVLVVPGGVGVLKAFEDATYLEFLRTQVGDGQIRVWSLHGVAGSCCRGSVERL